MYKPTSQLDEFSFVLAQGEQALTIPCPRDTRGNACIRLPALAGLSVGLAREPLPGMLGVRAENALGTDLFAPAVRIERMDGWYACETLTDGYTRPYGGMRMWASPLAGSWAELTADEPQAAGELAIYLDNALYRSYNNLRPLRDPLWRRFLHPALLRDFTVHLSGPDGEKTLRVRENIQRLVRLDLGGMRVSRVRVLPERTWGASYAAIHELALFAPERKSAYGTL